jgi:hypothetical protein
VVQRDVDVANAGTRAIRTHADEIELMRADRLPVGLDRCAVERRLGRVPDRLRTRVIGAEAREILQVGCHGADDTARLLRALVDHKYAAE